MMKRSSLAGLVAMLMAGAMPASAQIGEKVASLFDNFTDFSLFVTSDQYFAKNSALAAKSDAGRFTPALSYGAEFLWAVGKVGGGGKAPKTDCKPDPTSLTEVTVDTASDGRVNRTYKYSKVDCGGGWNDPEAWTIEMGLSYTRSRKLVGRDPNLGMSGVITTSPRVAIYAERGAWYGGLLFGFSKLEDLQIRDTANAIVTGSADAPTAGFAVGWSKELFGPLVWYVEASYDYAVFPTIKWANDGALAATAPRRADQQRLGLSVGFQLTVKEKKK